MRYIPAMTPLLMNPAVSADTVLRTLALAVARNEVGPNEPLPVIVAQEGLTQPEFDAISTNPMYQRYVDGYRRELKDSGFSFAAKCRVLAEDLLPTLYKIATDDDAPAAARVKSIENLVTWADLKPKENAALTTGPGFSISITVNGATTTIDTGSSVVKTASAPSLSLPVHDAEDAVLVRPVNNPNPIALLEPDEYEYAGEDILT